MKIGDYAYIKGISRDYGIGKITQLNSGYSSNGGELIDIQFKHSKHSVPKKEVISSPNIIDLIQVGDYVNGKLVAIVNDTSKCTGSFYQPNVQCRQDEVYDYEQIFDDEIKSIVTKEQFSSMEYKINDSK